MQTIYANSRRIVAALLIAALCTFAVLGALQGVDTSALVVIASALVASLLLVAVIAGPKPRFGVETLAFLVCALAVAISWGASPLEPAYLVYLPPLVVAIGFATIALMLRTEAGAARTKDRL